NGILALLRGIAYGVARTEEMVVDIVRSILLQHCALEQLADLLGLTFEHRSLIGNAHPDKMLIRIETGRRCLPEFAQKLVARSAVQHIPTKPFSIWSALDD